MSLTWHRKIEDKIVSSLQHPRKIMLMLQPTLQPGVSVGRRKGDTWIWCFLQWRSFLRKQVHIQPSLIQGIGLNIIWGFYWWLLFISVFPNRRLRLGGNQTLKKPHNQTPYPQKTHPENQLPKSADPQWYMCTVKKVLVLESVAGFNF